MNRFFEDPKVACDYLKYRPSYSSEIAEKIVAYLGGKDRNTNSQYELALDVGCGSGQFTRRLASYFARVVGLDISQAQINAAKMAKNPLNISFRVGKAEDLPMLDSSVDLITSATASHYFDWPSFCKEVDRVLKPNGCLAVLAYDLIYIDHPDDDIKAKLTECIETCVDYINDPALQESTPGPYREFKAQYREKLPLPFHDKKTMVFDFRQTMTVTEFIEGYKTWANFIQLLAANPDTDRFERLQEKIMQVLHGDDGGDPNTTMITIWAPVYVRGARKTSTEREDHISQ